MIRIRQKPLKFGQLFAEKAHRYYTYIRVAPDIHQIYCETLERNLDHH